MTKLIHDLTNIIPGNTHRSSFVLGRLLIFSYEMIRFFENYKDIILIKIDRN